ncbi:hypothetical protein BC938DRAFT_475290 [Jimgerdemannia flammicorona]|uniref:Rab-GAP TBC domain-containing protein n=1 Tax=Jimgerdemannia flammicorona TaxID=994334 RepID=A0A433PX13_9FUNG|nr:hypothetical protein BC938DRAFT_475290 [Jimgerdemannia flammicorona]
MKSILLRATYLCTFCNICSGNIVPYYALSWILTWYSHDLKDMNKVSRLFDLFLASTPLMPIYVAAMIVLSRKKELLELDPDLAHTVLADFPQGADMDELVHGAVELEKRWPPLELQKLSGVWLDDSMSSFQLHYFICFAQLHDQHVRARMAESHTGRTAEPDPGGAIPLVTGPAKGTVGRRSGGSGSGVDANCGSAVNTDETMGQREEHFPVAPFRDRLI